VAAPLRDKRKSPGISSEELAIKRTTLHFTPPLRGGRFCFLCGSGTAASLGCGAASALPARPVSRRRGLSLFIGIAPGERTPRMTAASAVNNVASVTRFGDHAGGAPLPRTAAACHYAPVPHTYPSAAKTLLSFASVSYGFDMVPQRICSAAAKTFSGRRIYTHFRAWYRVGGVNVG